MTQPDRQALADALARIAHCDAEDDAAFRLVFSQLEEPSPSDRFVGRVMAETRRSPVAARRRPSRVAVPWRRVAVGLGSVAAGIVVLLLPTGRPIVAAAMASAQWTLWVMTGGLGLASLGALTSAFADAWSTSVALGAVLGRALTSPELSLWLALSTGVGGGSVYGLVRVLSSEREVSSWVDPSSLA